MFKTISRHTVWIFIFVMVLVGYALNLWDYEGHYPEDNGVEYVLEGDTGKKEHEQVEERHAEEVLSPVVTVTTVDTFSEFMLTRERNRSRTISNLQKIIESESYSREIKSEAEEALLTLLLKHEQETHIESILKAQGIKDAIVTINNRAQVIVDMEITDNSQLYRIASAVTDVTGISRENVSIIEF